jgi:asparagine synthase (glutamine-hydrolysing)
LPPATVLNLATGNLRRWYELPSDEPTSVLADLRDGVALRLVADAPLCCLVSGGLDSSLILALAKKDKPDVVAYTAKIDEASPDLIAARRICQELEVPLVEVAVEPPDAAALSQAVRAIELDSQAQVEIAALCLPLAQAIASDGFKACLSGEAADELFGGYGNMCIAASRVGDAGWRDIRVKQLDKMARGNFVRCNKAFMAHGVECRLPFMHRPLVESVLSMGKADCPPGKKLLKGIASAVLPEWVGKRTKETFQGASGAAAAATRAVPNRRRFYTAELRNAYGQHKTGAVHAR